MSEPDLYVIRPMRNLYDPPAQIAKDETRQLDALREYVTALRGFADEDLKSAWSQVRDSYKGRQWPAVGLFVEAAKTAARERGGASRSRTSDNSEDRERQARLAAWDRVKLMPVAKTAALEGWAWSLKAKMLYSGLRAEQINPAEFRAAQNTAQKLAAKLEAGQISFGDKTDELTETFLTMRRTLLVNEAETAADIRRSQHQPKQAADQRQEQHPEDDQAR